MEKPSLYIGTKTEFEKGVEYIPFIKVVPKPFDSFSIKHQFADIKEYTHIIFTSKNAVTIFFQALDYFKLSQTVLEDKVVICIGEATRKALESFGVKNTIVSKEATQEGVIETLAFLDLKNAYVFYPRSSRARQTLRNALLLWEVRVQVCDLYDTVCDLPKELPDLNVYKEVIFSSPSTIDAFKSAFSSVPEGVKLKSIGPVTESYLKEKLPF